MTLFRTGDPRPIHFMGIAGAGMSALAVIARHRGVAITGCDSDASGAGLDDLTTLGVPVWRGHDPSHVDGARAVIVTEALTAAGRNPTGLAGGRVAAWGGNARIGGDELFVVEADEYDKAFLSLRPTVAVVNNV